MRKRIVPESNETEESVSSSPVTRSPHASASLCPPHRTTTSVTTWFPYSGERPWLTFPTEINVLWWAALGLAFVTRFWRIDYPRYVVFDEVHFGKFASYYLTRTFFFDVHPPLGKLIFAALGYSTGFNGSFLYSTIGVEYPHEVPYVLMRSASALAGTLLIPCVYQIMLELGFSHRAAFLASLFTVLDNSLIIQSRVIMLDSFVIFLSYFSILCYLRFYHLRHRPFSGAWHRSLVCTGLALGTLLGVKYTGLLGLGCVGLLTLSDLWQLVADTTIDLLDFLLHVLLRAVYMLGIPLIISLILFFIHFSILVNSGPGNAFVSKPFRKTLIGTVDTIAEPIQLSPNATLLRYGSHVSLRSTDLLCWLHSHPHLYPLKYPDDRGSSYQQQITCYEFADENNLWEVRKPANRAGGEEVNESDSSPVRNWDLVELVHVNTSKFLNSHDVAAPLTPTHQEVAGYINYSSQFVPHLSWKLDVVGFSKDDPIFCEKGKMKVKLIHDFSNQALSSTGKRLPEWAFQQYEVVTDREVDASSTLWIIDDIVPPNTTHTALWEEEEKAIRGKLQNPKSETEEEEDEDIDGLNFWEKYIEMQVHMVTAHGSLGEHQFGAAPQNWPLMGKLLPYWLDESSNAQVTLVGNPVMWWVSSASILLFLCVTAVYLLRRRRRCFDLPHGEMAVFHHWWTSGCVLLVGWLAHYLPYFLLSRVLFLHHYLPAVPFKLMLLAAVCEHFYVWLKRFPGPVSLLYYVFVSLLLLCFVISFYIFAPFTYGYPSLSREQIQWRKLYPTWDILHR